MTPNFENIKNRIERLKTEKAKAEGQKQSILDGWKRDYGINTFDEAIDLKSKIEKELEETKAAQEKYLADADALLTEAGV